MRAVLLGLVLLTPTHFAVAQSIENTGMTDVTSSVRQERSVEPSLSENGYDFNSPIGIPGFGPLTPDEIRRALDLQLRDVRSR